MFSREEKMRIAAAVEQVIKDIDHPEMRGAPIRFHLHVDGAESWSWADITPNDPNRPQDPNPWNEVARKVIDNG